MTEKIKECIEKAESVKEIREAYEIKSGTYILYPHKNARSVSQMSLEEIKGIKNIIAIDCTWHQTSVILFSKYQLFL